MRKLVLTGIWCAAMLASVSCGKKSAAPQGSGFIEATEIIISAQVSGTLIDRYYSEGDSVPHGAVLALIDTTSYALQVAENLARKHAALNQLASARLQVEKAGLDSSLADKEFVRAKDLLATGSANRQQFDRAETAYRQAALAIRAARAALAAASADLSRIEAGLRILREQLSYCRPVSPISGTMITKYADPGELLGIGRPILRLADLDTVWVEIYLPPRDLSRIRLRQEARVDLEDGSKPMTGWVSWISAEAEFTPKNVQTKEARADLVYGVKVTVANPEERLKIGMPVMVTIP
jgi:HlyD family secretion protein